jgi:alpha-glucosidase
MIRNKKLVLGSLIIAYGLVLIGCRSKATSGAGEIVKSPDGSIEVKFNLQEGAPYYQVQVSDQDVILPSRMGFELKDTGILGLKLKISEATRKEYNQTWTQPWGEVKEIREHYNELRIDLKETTPEPRQLSIIFRVFDDGVGFRYEWPEQEFLSDLEIMDELTEFNLNGDHQAWWIPAFWDNRYEYLYTTSRITEIPSDQVSAVHTPLTLMTDEGLYLTIHEAALVDYASMALGVGEGTTLKCELFPWFDGTKVKAVTPHQTPWRTIQIAENAGDLITSYLILNLNEPSVIEDTSWIKPGKYVGIWWGMHINTYTWGSGPNHGATTENALRYIDFASENGFDGVLIEGWNLGWDGDWTTYGNKFSFTEAMPDFDLSAAASYAASKGVKLIGHHETGAAIQNYENQLDDAFRLYQTLGINTIKTGYVGWGQGIKTRDDLGRLRGLEWHHGQFMVEHYRKVIETAADYQIMLNVHEPIKDTGERRTYPNMMTREGARGQEYDAWSDDGGNPPEHTTILPFTRMMAGPFDMTPGTFDILIGPKPDNRVNTTLAKQLALYVVIYSPLHMASDLPENYVDQPAFQFIRDVPTDWEDTRVLHASIGNFVTIVRQERDGEDWFLGSITDEEGRTLTPRLDFLDPERLYVAEIYADGAGADWVTNPYAIEISTFLVDAETELTLDLAPGGGTAIRFHPATETDIETLPSYQD